CLTFWCPCVTFGRLAGIVDKGSPPCCMKNGTLYVCLACVGCTWLYSSSPCIDFCVQFLCEGCALWQEYKELENRGFNMAKDSHLAKRMHRWEGSNKMVGCVQGMKATGKQGVCF
ncbi:hypothetical protein ZWY2020_054813, partial [Hordeum vulgare]